ncbi:MAG: WD40 repeat domain-containing protein, partial [Planctomycetes bacterium]|nr:WD40 repeat domain-containing protein [Planctomycetota bacterium]
PISWFRVSHDESMVVSFDTALQDSGRLWDVTEAGEPWVLAGHTSYVYGLAVSPDGSRIASGGWDDTIRCWDARTLRSTATLPVDADWVGGVAFSPDGTLLAAVDSRHRLRILDAATGTPRAEMADYGLDRTMPITWHPDGRRLLVAVADREISVFDRESGAVTAAPLERLREFRSGIVSPDGTRFVRCDAAELDLGIGDVEARLLLCATDSGRELARVECSNNGFKIAFSPPGAGPLRVLVPFRRRQGQHERHGWCLLDGRTGAKIAEREVGRAATMAVAFSPDGTRFVTGGYARTIHVWDAEHLDELVRLNGHTDYVFRLAFSPDGSRLYSASGDGSVRVWDTAPLSSVLLARRRQ